MFVVDFNIPDANIEVSLDIRGLLLHCNFSCCVHNGLS